MQNELRKLRKESLKKPDRLMQNDGKGIGLYDRNGLLRSGPSVI